MADPKTNFFNAIQACAAANPDPRSPVRQQCDRDAMLTYQQESAQMNAAATKTYIAMDAIDHGTNISNTRRYDIGEEIELSEQHAKPLLKLGAIVEKGDKLAAKIVAQRKEQDDRDVKEAHAKLEERANGQEPNNLGYTMEMHKIPSSPNPDYKIAGVSDGEASGTQGATVGKNVTAAQGAPAASHRASSGAAKVSHGKPASTAGKAPVGGRAKSGRK